MKILTIIGARPQIIKAAALSRAIRSDYADRIREVILHTGQHYDTNMSQVFFDEMGIPEADHNLHVGSGTHARQTAAMIEGIEGVIEKERPDWMVLYGDTNSTLAGSIASVKLGIPVAHIEAGLRSFNKSMPEEINRITCDHCSTLLFSPTGAGVHNLANEGFSINAPPPYSIDRPGVFHCGDVMYDNALHFSGVAEERSKILEQLEVQKGDYILATIHRDGNTDIPERLESIFNAIIKISHEEKLVLPLHPRTKKMIEKHPGNLVERIQESGNILLIPPVSFLDMIMLEKHASLIMTDSGGVQKESYFYHKPCLILRPETEWVEIVESGSAKICDAGEQKIMEAYRYYKANPPVSFPALYGDGKAAWFIIETILSS
jgi:UDP-GlcNAc3NAcA epimerase